MSPYLRIHWFVITWLILLLFCFNLSSSLAEVDVKKYLHDQSMRKLFAAYRAKFHKKYTNSSDEIKHFQTYVAHRLNLLEHRQRSLDAPISDNKFSDQSTEELQATILRTVPIIPMTEKASAGGDGKDEKNKSKFQTMRNKADEMEWPTTTSVTSIDWREKNATGPIRDQGNCGGCWAFATIGAAEALFTIKTGIRCPLSPQMLLSCNEYDDGCGGGLSKHGYQWLMHHTFGQIATEESYEFEGPNSFVPPCNTPKAHRGATVTGFKIIESNEKIMEAYVAEYGPIAVVLTGYDWIPYSEGVLTSCKISDINHAAVIVGFNKEANPPYWIMLNSWGDDWGLEGAIHVQMYENLCGITTQPTVPVLSAAAGGRTSFNAGNVTKPYTEIACSNSMCTENCNKVKLTRDACVSTLYGTSSLTTCSTSSLTRKIYESHNCSGDFTSEVLPIGKCQFIDDAYRAYRCR